MRDGRAPHVASTYSSPEEKRKREERNDTRADPLLPEQRRGWSLMIVFARATRGLRRLSLEARSGRSFSPHP
jgi:hypothetical protein